MNNDFTYDRPEQLNLPKCGCCNGTGRVDDRTVTCGTRPCDRCWGSGVDVETMILDRILR